MLMRLVLLGAGLTKALIGLWGTLAGDPGGELAIALRVSLLRQNVSSPESLSIGVWRRWRRKNQLAGMRHWSLWHVSQMAKGRESE